MEIMIIIERHITSAKQNVFWMRQELNFRIAASFWRSNSWEEMSLFNWMNPIIRQKRFAFIVSKTRNYIARRGRLESVRPAGRFISLRPGRPGSADCSVIHCRRPKGPPLSSVLWFWRNDEWWEEDVRRKTRRVCQILAKLWLSPCHWVYFI